MRPRTQQIFIRNDSLVFQFRTIKDFKGHLVELPLNSHLVDNEILSGLQYLTSINRYDISSQIIQMYQNNSSCYNKDSQSVYGLKMREIYFTFKFRIGFLYLKVTFFQEMSQGYGLTLCSTQRLLRPLSLSISNTYKRNGKVEEPHLFISYLTLEETYTFSVHISLVKNNCITNCT